MGGTRLKTLIRGAVVLTCDEHHTVHESGDLVIEGNQIAHVGGEYSGDYDTRVDASGHLLLPGLINTHTHSPMTIFRGIADDVDLHVFLTERVWPREVLLTPEDVYAGSLLADVEMLKSGVTASVDMYFWEEESARAAIDSGIRSRITPGILESPAWEPIIGTWEERTARVLEFCRTWDGREGRISTGFGPHAPYTLPLEALAEISRVARDHGYPLHIHLVETARERDDFRARGLGSTIAALEDIGFFEASVLAAHSVWMDPGDEQIYARRGVGVAHCPQSNAKLGAGVAPLATLLAHEVSVGLGTDGAATNNNLDLWEEIRLAPLLAKVTALDPKPVPAGVVLWMATRLGAQAAHLPQLGVLAPGYRADVVMLDIRDTTAVPIFGPDSYIGLVVYSMGRESVDSVWVEGRRVVKDGQVLTVDEEKARADAQRAAGAVSKRLEALT